MDLSSRDLVDGLLRGGAYDRVGLYDHWWPETTRLWVRDGYPVTAQDGAEPVPADPVVMFGYDMRPCGGWFDVNPHIGVNEVVEETAEWVVTRNGSGAALKFWKHKSGTPEHIDFRMTSREVWERDYRPHLIEPDRRRVNTEAARVAIEAGRADGRWCFFGGIHVWETMRQAMGDVCMYESLVLDPGWIHDYNRVYTDLNKWCYQVLFDEVGLPDGIWLYEDLGYRNGLLASPRVLSELVFPYYAEMVAFFHDRGLPVVLHSCGGITQAVPLIVDAGFDALNPMEVKAGCDLFALAERYGDRLAFCGGLDIRILETNDRAAVERGVRDIIEGMKRRGARFLFGSDHSISPRVRYDTYRFALDVYRECMAY